MALRFPKHEYVRSKRLLENARLIPCQRCGTDDGTVVAAHTNWGSGKGRSIKADDNMIASLCFHCHADLDQGSHLNRDDRKAIWERAHLKTVYNLMKNNLWPDDVPLPRGFS